MNYEIASFFGGWPFKKTCKIENEYGLDFRIGIEILNKTKTAGYDHNKY